MAKQSVFQIRLDPEELSDWKDAAREEGCTLASWIRKACLSRIGQDGEPLTAEQIEDVAEATAKDAEMTPFVPIVPPVSRAESKPSSKFKPSKGCTNSRCAMIGPVCDSCRKAAAKGFA